MWKHCYHPYRLSLYIFEHVSQLLRRHHPNNIILLKIQCPSSYPNISCVPLTLTLYVHLHLISPIQIGDRVSNTLISISYPEDVYRRVFSNFVLRQTGLTGSTLPIRRLRNVDLPIPLGPTTATEYNTQTIPYWQSHGK